MSDPQWLRDARRKGLDITEGPAAVKQSKESVKLIVPTFRRSTGWPVWEIPLVTTSEVNSRDWRKRSKRTDAAWAAVSKAVGRSLNYLAAFAFDFHDLGLPVYARFTRLGGRKLDKSNLPTALKATEDALCFMMGADDGAANWHPSWAQEPCDGMGVRIELSSEPFREANHADE